MSLFLAKLVQQQCRGTAFCLLSTRTASNFTMTQAPNLNLSKNFLDKNKQLNRPLSPHLSIYKPQITTILSISHRFTGLGISALLYAGGIGALFSSGSSFPEIVQLIQHNVPSFLILATKTAIGGSLIYHTLNGVRHLVWDVGYGFQLKHLYMSGYVVVVLTAIGTALVFIKG